MKSALIASIILIILVTVVFLYGIITPEHLVLRQEVSVEAPEPAVYNLLTSFADYASWSPVCEVLRYSDKQKTRSVRYLINSRRLLITESCMTFPETHTIQMVQIDSLPTATIYKFNQHVALNSQADGSTTIQWSLEYDHHTLMGRILDRWFVRPAMRRFLAAHLQGLKNHLER